MNLKNLKTKMNWILMLATASELGEEPSLDLLQRPWRKRGSSPDTHSSGSKREEDEESVVAPSEYSDFSDRDSVLSDDNGEENTVSPLMPPLGPRPPRRESSQDS